MWIAVAIGAMAGASLRYALSRWFLDSHDLHMGTLLANVIGSFILGVTVPLAGALRISPRASALIGTGFCGALTTFSALAVETVARLDSAYVLIAIATGYGAAVAGLRTGKALVA